MAFALEHTMLLTIVAGPRVYGGKLVMLLAQYGSYRVRTWDGVSEAEIGDFDWIAAGSGYLTDLTVFRGQVYVSGTAVETGVRYAVVYRYNDIPGDWTRVLHVTYTDFAGYWPNCYLGQDGSGTTMLLNTMETIEATADGTSWVTEAGETIDGTGNFPNVSGFWTVAGDVFLPGRSANKVFSRNAGWTEITWYASGDTGIIMDGPLAEWYGRKSVAVVGTSWYYTGGAWVQTTPTGFTNWLFWRVWGTGGLSWLVKNKYTPAVDNQFYYWNGTNDWTAFDSDATWTSGIVGIVVLQAELYAAIGASIYKSDQVVPSTGGLTPGAGIGTNMAIDADGAYLYIGALDSSKPVCVKLAASLGADGTIEYDPGTGDFIEVACGRLDPDRVWVNGNFGTPKLRLSKNGGTTWATIDPAWAGVSYVRPVRPWVRTMEGITALTHNQQDAYSTADDGVAWSLMQAALPFIVGAFDVLDVSPTEAVIGTFTPGANRVNLTVNDFATFYNLTAGTPNARVTKVIVG